MLKQICVLFSMLIGGISPLGIAILGYFVFFLGFDWSYLVIWMAVWIVSVSLGVFVAKKEKRFEFYYELLGNGFGWVWLVSIPTSIWFLIFALFMDGSWWKFFYSLVLGGLCKGWTRSFMQAERELIENEAIGESNGEKTDTLPFEEVEAIVKEFGSFVLQCNPPLVNSFHDIESLPYPKNKIRDALIQGIRLTDNSEMLRSMRGALFTCLPCFQAQVGSKPISISNSDATAILDQSSPNPTPDEMQEMAEKFLEGNNVGNEKIPELQQLFEKDVSEYSQILDQQKIR